LITVEFQRVDPDSTDLPLPRYMTSGSAAMDMAAAVDEPVVLKPGETSLIPTGFRMALPEGYEAQIRPRSGLAAKHGVTVLNTPGTIDSDYRGEVKVILANFGHDSFQVVRGLRICQMVIAPVIQVLTREVTVLSETDRGEGGFGHTGEH